MTSQASSESKSCFISVHYIARDKTGRTLSVPLSFNLFLSDKSDRDRYTARIERVRRLNGLEVFYQEVTRQEKDLIVKAMGLTQGHWFKCPKGKFFSL